MRITDNPDLCGVMNAMVVVPFSVKRGVSAMLVSVDGRRWQDAFLHERNQGMTGHVRNNLRDDVTTALNRSSNDGLVIVLLRHAATATYPRLVNLYATAKRVHVLFQHRADLLEHAPSCFVGNSRLALQLLRRDTATGGSHQEDRVKPRFQRRAGLVIDGVGGWVDVVAAKLARIRFSGSDLVMLRNALARFAENAVRVEVVFQPFKASII